MTPNELRAAADDLDWLEQEARIQALKNKARAGELREELIQVAAVAVAIVEDLDYGEANFAGVRSNRSPLWYRGDDVLLEVAKERMAQDEKWGPQHHSPMKWLAILGEEFGEACRAARTSRSMKWW